MSGMMGSEHDGIPEEPGQLQTNKKIERKEIENETLRNNCEVIRRFP